MISLLLLGHSLASNPIIEVGGRVTDLFNGEHFDDLLREAADPLRPPSLVVFHNSKDRLCTKKYYDLHLKHAAESQLPARERLLIASYDMGVDKDRIWYQWTHEKDLPARFGVNRETECPSVVFVPKKCNGWTEWCVGPDGKFGCPEFKEQCSDWVRWKGERADGPWVRWALDQIKREGPPKVARELGSFAAQGEFLQHRSLSTTNNMQRNSYLIPHIPTFTDNAFEMHDIPKDILDELIQFYYENKHRDRTESWDTGGSTQVNYHEVETRMVDLDRDRGLGDRVTEALRPMLQKWARNRPLQRTSFYGIRVYGEGAVLQNHIDRIETHVISVTMSLLKVNNTSDSEWPIVAVDPFSGEYKMYDHPPGTMLFYESAKVIHGRPFKNPVGGGYHLGCFLHFLVENSDYSEHEKAANDNLHKHERMVDFRSTPSVEPDPADEDAWFNFPPHLAEYRPREEHHQVKVWFTNDLDIPFYLFWIGPDGALPRGYYAPGVSADIDSFPGHVFRWSLTEAVSNDPALNVEIETEEEQEFRTSNLNLAHRFNKVEL